MDTLNAFIMACTHPYNHDSFSKNTMEDASDPLRSMLPASFGGGGTHSPKNPNRGNGDEVANRGTRNPVDARDDDELPAFVGPPAPVLDHDKYDDDEDEGEDFCGSMPPPSLASPSQEGAGAARSTDLAAARHVLPCSSVAFLEGHAKAVTALDVDPQGTRVVTGSSDYSVRLFDFTGMKSDCRSFKSIVPSEGHPVLSLSWSPTGDAFMAVTTDAQAQVYTRDGVQECVFPRGDMYIRDLTNTSGHITSCTDGCWSPVDKGSGVTSSADGTVRVWDMYTVRVDLLLVLIAVGLPGGKTRGLIDRPKDSRTRALTD